MKRRNDSLKYSPLEEQILADLEKYPPDATIDIVARELSLKYNVSYRSIYLWHKAYLPPFGLVDDRPEAFGWGSI